MFGMNRRRRMERANAELAVALSLCLSYLNRPPPAHGPEGDGVRMIHAQMRESAHKAGSAALVAHGRVDRGY